MKNRMVTGLLDDIEMEEITFQEKKKGDETNEVNVWQSPIIGTASPIAGLLQPRTQVRRIKLCSALFNTSGCAEQHICPAVLHE